MTADFPVPAVDPQEFHASLRMKRYDREGVTIQDGSDAATGHARDCACGWRGVMWADPEGADREVLDHIASSEGLSP